MKKSTRIDKFKVRDLLDGIAGGREKKLSIEHLKKYRNTILDAVQGMKNCYENKQTSPDDPTRLYYAPCWKQIAEAKDDEVLVEALFDLRSAINWD